MEIKKTIIITISLLFVIGIVLLNILDSNKEDKETGTVGVQPATNSLKITHGNVNITDIISSDIISINYNDTNSWSEPYIINDFPIIAVLADSVTPRVYLNITTPSVLKIDYIDTSNMAFDVNINIDGEWYNIARVKRTNTNELKTVNILVPYNLPSQLGIYAWHEDLIINKLSVNTFNSTYNRVLFDGSKGIISNETTPNALFIYMGFIKANTTIDIDIDSHGKEVSIEVFNGVIQLYKYTNWWIENEMIYRIPEKPFHGLYNPKLRLDIDKDDFYTIVIIYWGVRPISEMDPLVDFKIRMN